MTPKVSVVSTVYNGVAYLDRAIPGILNQTFTDFEFILVDDGSTDNTLDELTKVARSDPRVKVFAPGRLGAAAAYNYGVAQATGEYVARQDFDDRSYPDRLRLQVALLELADDRAAGVDRSNGRAVHPIAKSDHHVVDHRQARTG